MLSLTPVFAADAPKACDKADAATCCKNAECCKKDAACCKDAKTCNVKEHACRHADGQEHACSTACAKKS
jgi:hypothetical protein